MHKHILTQRSLYTNRLP